MQTDQPDVNSKLKEQLAKERAKAAVKAAKDAKAKKRPAEEMDDHTARAPSTRGPEPDGSDEQGGLAEPGKRKTKRSKADRLNKRGSKKPKLVKP